MIAVILEVFPAKGKMNEYLDLASSLRDELNKTKGFISIEKFQSLSNPDKLLSLSFWENEDTLSAWRNSINHRNAQSKSRSSIFSEYHIRVGLIERDYGISDRENAPEDSNLYHSR